MMDKNKWTYKLVISFVGMVLSFILVLGSSFAWFAIREYSSDKDEIDANNLSIEKSPVLYLLDSDAQSVVQLNLSGLVVGKSRDYVFCVSSEGIIEDVNKIPTGQENSNGDDTKKAINLELAYTKHIGATYSIQYAEYVGKAPVKDAFAFTSQNGATLYYKKGNEVPINTKRSYTGSKDENVEYKYFQKIRFTKKYYFFILHVDLQNANTAEEKETDVIYIIAKGDFMSNG